MEDVYSTLVSPVSQKVPSKKSDLKDDISREVYYIVTIKQEYMHEFSLTTIHRKFCGKLEYINSNFYFRLNGSNALVIIPHTWIETMAPSKELWDKKL